jgi:hypothetical protein
MKNEILKREDAMYHVRNLSQKFKQLREHLKEDIQQIEEPRAQALFETTAEVLEGVTKAFDDYLGKNETAWRT